MAKRKATSPLTLVNGDDEGHSGGGAELVATPKRSLGSGLSVVPSSLSFDTPAPKPQAPGRRQFSNLDSKVAEKMSKVNDAFMNKVAGALSERPDILLFPLVESYVRHVHAILTPHLPKYLTVLDKDKSFESLAKFIDKFRTAVSASEVSDKDKNSKPTTMGSVVKKESKSNDGPTPVQPRKIAVSGSSLATLDEKPSSNIFANFKFGSPSSTITSLAPPNSSPPSSDTPFKAAFDGFKNSNNNVVSKSPEKSKPINSVTSFDSTNTGTGYSFAQSTSAPFKFDKSPSKSNGIIPGLFPPSSVDKQNSLLIGGVTGSGFSFMTLPSSNLSGGNNSAAKAEEQDNEESDEPPINDFKQVEEDDALYEVRCKVFSKQSGGQYKDKGIGKLFVKKTNGQKFQVVVRAENNLGTILLNILLQKGLPLCVKKKDILITDPVGDNGKPMMMLIRVKNEDAAAELLNKLQDFIDQSS